MAQSELGPDRSSNPGHPRTPEQNSDLSEAIARKRRELAPEIQALKLHHETMGSFSNGHAASPEEVESLDRRLAEEALRQQRSERIARWKELIRKRGERYSRCTLDNFETPTRDQITALEDVRTYATNMPDRLKDGGGIVLWGPPGTGKDHLLAALSLIAIRDHGWSVSWENGTDLFGEVRDRMDGKETEASLIKRMVWPSALWISDPLPPFGKLSDFQASMLFRIIDARYSRCRPTWITVNVASSQEAKERMGPQVVDRLRHGSLTVLCNWPSFRSS